MKYRMNLLLGPIAIASFCAVLLAGDASGTGLLYVAPPHTNGHVRVDANTSRGSKLPDKLKLRVLAPDHVGLTIQEQPKLYWYLSEPTNVKMVMTIMKKGGEDPLLEMPLDATVAGIQGVDLAKQNIKLERDVEYLLSFALVPDPAHRANDLYASGVLKRIKPPEPLVAKLSTRADPLDRAVACARQGIWYDALSIISDEIDTGHSRTIRAQRAALLDQVNLADAANYDRANNAK